MREPAKSGVRRPKSDVQSPKPLRARPVVVVSACLLGERCRYDGKMISAPWIQELAALVKFVPVCPETGIGLDVPRLPIRLVETARGIRLMQTLTGKDLTRRMRSFSRTFLAEHKADGFILTARSPSCAVEDAPVYDEVGQETGIELHGIFADEVLNRSLSALIEDEEGLRDSDRMDSFIAWLFAPRPVMKKRRSR
jgi:uncharacterized protein YbbK (DUF523 family)